MADEQQSYFQGFNPVTRIRDIEEKQKVLKDRVLLIGKNLIEIREKRNKEFLELKQEIEKIKQDMKRLISFLETASAEFSKFARKEEVEILTKQAKMFQPLDFIKKDELKEILKEAKKE